MRLGSFPLLPRRKKTDKRDYGHVLVLAGSAKMPGAAVLASLAALKSGAGLVTLGTPAGLATILKKKIYPEMMYLPLPQSPEGSLGKGAYKVVKNFMGTRKVSVIALGPGLSVGKEAAKFVREVISQSAVPVVLDADGLNSFRGSADLLKKRKGSLVLTPHAGEFKRLFGASVPVTTAQRISLAKKFATRYHSVLVLKGHPSLVTDGRLVYINSTGGPAMAKGGAGDVLTGIIAAFMAEGLSPLMAASWAVRAHGRAGDLAARQKSELGVLASDLIEFLPEAFKSF